MTYHEPRVTYCSFLLNKPGLNRRQRSGTPVDKGERGFGTLRRPADPPHWIQKPHQFDNVRETLLHYFPGPSSPVSAIEFTPVGGPSARRLPLALSDAERDPC
jgi:hypothetical protein